MSCTFDGPDRYAVVCNFAVDTKTATRGTRAYLAFSSHGDPDSINLRFISRGGRWITKYERLKRVFGFRVKAIPAQHPMYAIGLSIALHATRESAEQEAQWYRNAQTQAAPGNDAETEEIPPPLPV